MVLYQSVSRLYYVCVGWLVALLAAWMDGSFPSVWNPSLFGVMIGSGRSAGMCRIHVENTRRLVDS
jgi:hypothetical protein